MSEDPIEFRSGDHNLYRYVLNRPISGIDPLGQGIIEDHLLARICQATDGRCCNFRDLKDAIACSITPPKDPPKDDPKQDPPKNMCPID